MVETPLTIRPLVPSDIPTVTAWARQEGFSPGVGDVAIYRQTDRQGLWVGWLAQEPVGCIAGVRYNNAYGFIGLFLVAPPHRGRGYGVRLWRHVLDHLADLPCIGLEAAPDRIEDYAGWGFVPASATTRWQRGAELGEPQAPCEFGTAGQDALGQASCLESALRMAATSALESRSAPPDRGAGVRPWCLLEGRHIPEAAVQRFDALREPSPRPHFLHQWLQHPAGTVHALLDRTGACRGFGRIRPCLLQQGEGWRIGPLVADEPAVARALLEGLLQRHPGVVLLDVPGANAEAAPLLEQLGFVPVSSTLRMYRGAVPSTSLADVYGLACLELG